MTYSQRSDAVAAGAPGSFDSARDDTTISVRAGRQGKSAPRPCVKIFTELRSGRGGQSMRFSHVASRFPRVIFVAAAAAVLTACGAPTQPASPQTVPTQAAA